MYQLLNSMVMNVSALYSSIIVVYPLKISWPSLTFKKHLPLKTGVISLVKQLVSAAFSVVFIRFKLTK